MSEVITLSNASNREAHGKENPRGMVRQVFEANPRCQSEAAPYSTPQAAKKIGVSFVTLHRWLRDGKIRPQAVPLEGHNLWVWPDADIAKGGKVKAAQKPGPKAKGGKR